MFFQIFSKFTTIQHFRQSIFPVAYIMVAAAAMGAVSVRRMRVPISLCYKRGKRHTPVCFFIRFSLFDRHIKSGGFAAVGDDDLLLSLGGEFACRGVGVAGGDFGGGVVRIGHF